MKKRTIFGKVSKVVFLGIFFGLFALPTDAFCSDLTVLILHSYSQEYPWTKKEHDGFVSSLNKEHHDCNHSISTESLDSKRVPFTEEYQHFFFRYLKAKYENFKPDFIFCTDDNALIFLMRYKSELFPEAPVVFCGVNDTLLTTKLDRHQFVGVLEVKEIIPNLALAQKLRPGLRKVFIIGDDSSTYRAIKERILQDFQGRFPGMELEFLANQQLAPIVEKLSTEQTGILVLSTIGGLHNARGEIMPLHRSIKKIQDAGNFIVMSMEDAYVIGGVLGGVVTSGQLQGKAAALLAEKLIKGIAAESIPLVEKSPNLPLFDFRQIKRFAVSEAILPEGSVFLHRPETIYQQHKKEVLTALAVFALLVIVLAILSVNVLRRKRAEQSLKESEKRYREIYNSPNDAIFIHDGETGKVLDVNESMLEMYGYHRDEALRLTIDDLSSGEEPYSQHEAEGRIRAALEKEPQIFEWLAKKKSGELFWVEVSLKYSEIVGQGRVLAVVRDISERKRAEQEKVKLESELRQAQKMEAIGTLAGGIAHDFNNILAAIVGYNELAQEAAKDEPELLEYLQEVHCAALRARNLVRQILTFSRKSNKDNEPLQMSLLVQESLKMLRSTIPASIEIKQNISTKAKVFADPTQIHQVIMNLCTNAYQAMRETGGVLGVSLREVVLPNESFVLEAKPGKYLLLEVSDTGAGIDKERMDKIFEPYFTTKDKGQGTGLGLAVVYGIVQSLDGHLTLDSEPGKGSTFQIYLPVHAGEVRLPEANPEPVDRGSERIMLIDDEELIVKMTASNLSASGYQVSTFTDGEEALKRFLDNPDGYDLVITDMTMPKMSGAELAQNILERHPDVPIILCTGYNETINRSKALALGIKGYLEKPILRNDLLRAVREALD